MRTPAYSVRFTTEELEQLRSRARREKRPISSVIRLALAHQCSDGGSVSFTASGGVVRLAAGGSE